MPLYADIVLPLAQPAYTFAVPEGMHVAEGTAVAVQFGPRKFYTGVVWRVHDRRPPFRTIKSIQRVLYDAPLLSAQQKALWEWIAAYYMCSAGEVMRVALPSLMKPSGDTEEEFAEDEFRPRTECYVALARELHDEGRLHEVFEKLGRRAPKQYEALLEIASAGDETRISTGEVARRLLRADYAVLHALERKGHIVCTERERTVERGGSAFRLPELTAPQREALGSLREQFAEKPAALLHGVTGSGKTEIYIHLIAETLARGGDVLLLVPEIALTAQLIGRMERIFGSRVTPYHSKLTNRRRTETYLRLNCSQGGEFVVGVRSSIFLPLKHLQLIIVDEEHDASYKQADPAPRYNARDCAVVMARLWGGRTLLGSATPSLETWLNAEGGKYGRAVLAERYGDARPPEIFVSDTIRAAKRGERHAHFNKLLLDKMEETLGRGEQVMLFQNRRGFSPYVECSQCGWTARCPHCNVTLTYHKGGARLVCHYCGYTAPVPAKCPSCEVTEVHGEGRGGDRPALPRSPRRPAGPRQRDLRAGVQRHNLRFRSPQDRYSGRDADDYEGIRLRRRVAGGNSQCRQPAEQPRFPGRRTGFPADDAGGGPRRTARRRGRGGDPDLRTGASRDPAGRSGRFRGDGPRTARRAQSLFLSALCAAHVAHAAPPRPFGAPKRGHGPRRTPAHPFRPPSAGADDPARRPHPRRIPRGPSAENRERRLFGPRP